MDLIFFLAGNVFLSCFLFSNLGMGLLGRGLSGSGTREKRERGHRLRFAIIRLTGVKLRWIPRPTHPRKEFSKLCISSMSVRFGKPQNASSHRAYGGLPAGAVLQPMASSCNTAGRTRCYNNYPVPEWFWQTV